MNFEQAPYRQACINTINQYIRDATRLDEFTFDIHPIEIFELDFDIALEVKISSRVMENEVLGIVKGNENNPIFSNSFDYQNALQALTEAEIIKPQNFQLVNKIVHDHAFGFLYQTTDLHHSTKTVGHCYECPQCSAKGIIKCTSCSGSGQKSCGTCSGSGYTARTTHVQTSQGPRLQTNNVSCSSCSGSGKCRCGKCRGSGDITCPTCEGKKYFTKISTVITIAEPNFMPVYQGDDTPAFITEALYHYGMHKLSQLGPVQFSTQKETSKKSLQFLYKAQCPFAKFKSIIKEKEIFWILYGQKPIIFESSNVVETLLIEDLTALEHSARVTNLLKPYIARACKKSVSNFTKSEVNQELIELSINTSNLEKTRDDLKRSVSVNYLEITHTAFRKLTKAINTWSFIKWALFAFICLMLYSTGIILAELSPKTLTTLSEKGFHWLPTFYHDLYREDGVLPGGASISKLWNKMLYPILAISFVPYILRIVWLRFWVKRKMPYLYKWMVNQNTLATRWVAISIITLLASGFILNYVQIPIYNGSLLGLLPIDWALNGIHKLQALITNL